jgi:hypothetical protein
MAGTKWSEKKIERMVAAGRGEGHSKTYHPWIEIADISSLGRSRRVWSPKTGRVHHLLSDVEYRLFVALEWQRSFIDIREQYPLDRSLTQDIARSLGIAHPYYPGTQVPTVMTVDFLVTCVRGNDKSLIAFNAKTAAEAEDVRSMHKLEIQREYFEQMGIDHHIVFDCDIPPSNVANISDIREAPLRPDEQEPRLGYFDELCMRMLADMPSASRQMSLVKYCAGFDERYGCLSGVGIRVARMLMHQRALVPDLGSPNLNDEPLSRFIMLNLPVRTRAIGEK